MAEERAKGLCADVRQFQFPHCNETMHVTLSRGIATFPEHGDTSQQLMQCADLSLYQAKHQGRDRVVVFVP